MASETDDNYWTVEEVKDRILEVPSEKRIHDFFGQLKSYGYGENVSVRMTESMGKGAFATKHIKKGELVLVEPVMLGVQHLNNKLDALNCGYCMKFLGPADLQLVRKLEYIIEADNDLMPESQKSFEEGEDEEEGDPEISWTTERVIRRVLAGEEKLPLSEMVDLPPAVNCRGKSSLKNGKPSACREVYCSNECEIMAWSCYHSHLCLGEGSMASDKAALAEFYTYSMNDPGGDIFLAAKVLCLTISRARDLKRRRFAFWEENGYPEGEAREEEEGSVEGRYTFYEMEEMSLAFRPFGVACRKPWTECPDVVEYKEVQEEAAAMAENAVNILKRCIFVERYAPLFTVDVFSHIVGMFRLNNFDVIIPSPLEEYNDIIGQQDEDTRKACKEITDPLFHALRDPFAPCKGSGFYNIMSTFNHSCDPDAELEKSTWKDGSNAKLVALRPILPGKQIFISYIGEDQQYEQRKKDLMGYGFECHCRRCKRTE